MHRFLFVFACFCFNLFCFSANLFAQPDSKEIDSLYVVLETARDTNRINVLNEISRLFEFNSPEKALKINYQILAESKRLKFQRGVHGAYQNMGIIHKEQGSYDSAFFYFNEALHNPLINSPVNKCKLFNNLGITYYEVNQLDKALYNYLNAYYIGEKAGLKDIMATTLNNIANVYFAQENLPKAIASHKKSLALSMEINRPDKIASSYNNIGLVFSKSGQGDSALFYFEKALELARQVKNTFGESLVLANMGSVYIDKKDFVKAIEFFKKSLELKLLIGDKKGTANNYARIAEANLELGLVNTALENYLKSIELAEPLGSKEIIAGSSKGISQAYHKQKNYEKEAQYLRKYITIKLELDSLDHADRLIEFETKFETHTKEKEIALQKLNISQKEAEVKRKNAQELLLIFGMVFLTIILVVTVINYKQKKRANLFIIQQKEEVEKQKKIVDDHQKEMLDSIFYASRIQQALLPGEENLKTIFPDSFLLNKPKNIVSGDFFWINHASFNETYPDTIIFALADCTGHGVPGGFMSMLGVSFLNEIVNERQQADPGAILNELRQKVIQSLKQSSTSGESKDGMDMVICKYNRFQNKLEYASANSSFYLVRQFDGSIVDSSASDLAAKPIELKAQKMPVGFSEISRSFETRSVDTVKGDAIYLLSDGYVDQFGGAKGKKLKHKLFLEVLKRIQTKPMTGQVVELDNFFEEWKGINEQVDDICVAGIKLI